MPFSENYFRHADGTTAGRTAFDYIRDHLGYRLDLPWWVSPGGRYGINIMTTVKIK